MRRSKASSFFIMISLLGCAAACRSGKPDDLTPRFLPSSAPQSLEAPPLSLRKRIILRDCESLGMQYILTVTPAEDGYYLFTSQGIGQIDSTGRVVRLLGNDLLKQRTPEGYRQSSQGFTSSIPQPSKSVTFRVARHAPRDRAMAAICASN